jgi:hypothetical protein
MKYCLLFVAALFVLGSCEKVDVPVSKAQMLRDNRWKVSDMKLTYLTSTGGDSLSESTIKLPPDFKLPDCILDDYLQFRENHDGSHIPGPDKCKTGESDDIYFEWGLTENDTKIYLYGMESLFGRDIDGDVVEITDSKFTFSYFATKMNSANEPEKVKMTAYFVKK